jgi:hypothetical protein
VLEPHTPIDVQRAVLLPGMTLLICGVISLIYPFVMVGKLFREGPAEIVRLEEEGTPEMLKWMLDYQEKGDGFVIARTVVGTVFVFFTALGMVLGGVNMLRLSNYWLAVVGCILAIVPGPMCLFSAPLGVWSLFILRMPEVREAFGAPTEEESTSDEENPEQS